MDYVAENIETNIVRAGFFGTIFAATVGLASTSAASRELIEFLRLVAIVAALVALGVHFLLVKGFNVTFLGSLFLLVTIYVVGLSLGINYGGVTFVLADLPRDFSVAVLLLYFLGAIESSACKSEGERLARFIFIYVSFLVVLLVLSNGLLLDYPPRFVNEYSTAERGSLVQYSQGVSKIFALGGIAAAFLFFFSERIWKIIALSGAAVFISLSFLGGARGDSVAGVFVILLIALRFAPIKTALVSVLVVLLILTFGFRADLLSDFIIFQRFLSLSAGVDTRASLLNDAVALLADNPACLFLGCGFGYFEKYYGYSAGLYPHNFVLEFLISLGVIVLVPLILAAVFGLLLKIRASGFLTFGLYVFLYFSFVAMKSGSLLSAWFVLVPLVYYGAVGCFRVSRGGFIENAKLAP